MNVVVKNVPENLKISWEINFWYFMEVLSNNFIDVDFIEIEDKNISQSMVDNLKEMKNEISSNWLKNFTSLSS